MIRVNNIDFHGSVSDGPGIRIVLFLQGCLKRCEGCQNPETWDINGGYLIDEELLFELISKTSPIRRITISGGEPLLQMDSLIKLLSLLDESNYDIALYTGYEYDEVSPEILKYLTYLKTGRFIKNIITTVTYYGSTNQRFYKLRDEYEG